MGRKEGEEQAVGVLSKYLNFPPSGSLGRV